MTRGMLDTLTIEEAAAVLRVHGHTIRKYLNSGDFPGFRVGPPPHGQWRIPKAEFEEYLRGNWQSGNGNGGGNEDQARD